MTPTMTAACDRQSARIVPFETWSMLWFVWGERMGISMELR